MAARRVPLQAVLRGHRPARAAQILDEVAFEEAERVRRRIAGIAQSLRESGVVLRSVDIRHSERAELLGCVQAN